MVCFVLFFPYDHTKALIREWREQEDKYKTQEHKRQAVPQRSSAYQATAALTKKQGRQ